VQVDPRLAYEKLSDPILVTRAKHGDTRALDVLITRHAPKVERLALHMLRDPDDARDAAQEALAKACTRLGQFRGDAQFSTWLHRIALNTCRDAYARRRVHEPLAEELQAAHDVSELRRELCDSLTRVPPAQARAVLGHALGLTFEEIAADAGIPVGTAKCQAHRGRARLREQLRVA
jgi:RNA polymerase sigma-70 factor (ECF subfamily)